MYAKSNAYVTEHAGESIYSTTVSHIFYQGNNFIKHNIMTLINGTMIMGTVNIVRGRKRFSLFNMHIEHLMQQHITLPTVGSSEAWTIT